MSFAITGEPAAFVGDDELLAACRRGDVRAYEQLYAAHSGRMKSIALHMLGNRQDAEDAVQETFLKVFRGVNGFQGQSAVGTWMCRILINTCYDALRKQRPEAAEMPAPAAMPGRGSSVPLKVALEGALGRIAPNHRLVFWLYEVEGYRHSEIGQILQVPEGTSKSWLFEAKRALRRMLGEGLE